MTLPKLWNTRSFFELALPGLTMMLGLQTLRVLIPSIVWYLGDTLALSSIVLGVIALGIFALSFLVIPFYRALGLRRALIGVLLGIGIARLMEQVLTVAALDFIFALVGTVLFTFFIPLYLMYVRGQGGAAPRKFGRGMLLGLVFDTTIHGSFHTLDLSWQQHSFAPIIAVLVVLAQLALTLYLVQSVGEATETNFIGSLPLAALGPFIFVTQVIFQNIARATALTGFPMPQAYAFIVIVNAIGISAALLPIVAERSTAMAAIVATLFLAWLTWRPEPQAGTTDLMFFFGNLLLFPFITLILASLGAREEINKGLTRTALANGIGWLLFAVLTLLYYVSYDINLGFPNAWLPPLAVILIGLAVLWALRVMPNFPMASSTTSATVAFALVVVPLIIWANWQRPQPVVGKGFPVRVMTYNIHNGFNTAGRLDPEAIARVIEQAKPDIVALQEVSRGWYIDSSVDLAMWLSRRLQMPYIFGPTADRVWGNAILSRYPIKEWKHVPLPPRNLLLKRGFLWARIDLGSGDELLFIATHFHHIEEDSAIRQLQALEIVKFWNQRPRTVFVGDLNAKPDAPEIAILREAGLRDAFALIGSGSGLTWPSDKPNQRIDYIWVSPDLTVRNLGMPRSTASDHLGVVVTVEASKK
jgi:endonuclease/exonuclease/phosphatase family metal-dependent hydrolase